MYDLPDAPEVVTAIAALLAGAAAMWGAVTAHKGLSSWKAQAGWQVDIDLSRRLLLCIRRREDAFRALRNPMFWAAELEAARNAEAIDEPEDGSHNKSGRIAAVNLRLKELQKHSTEMYALSIEADALWSSEIEGIHNRLSKIERKVFIALTTSFEGEVDVRERQLREFYRAQREIAYGTDDAIAQEYGLIVETAVEKLKKLLEHQRK